MGKVLDLIVSKEEHFQKALGAKRDFASWWAQTKVWVTQKEADPFQDYERVSKIDVLGAYTAAAINGLMIDGEEGMVMIRGKKSPKIKFEIGARGVVRKYGQAGWHINSRTVKEGDLIELDEGAGFVRHTPAALVGKRPGASIGHYAVAKRKGGIQVVRFLSHEDALKRSTGTGAWEQWEDEMCQKSVILTLRKVLYGGDEIEDLIASSGAEVGDAWGYAHEESEAGEEPSHPPQSTRDKVLAQAARDEQDEAAEQPEPEPEDEREPPSGPASRAPEEPADVPGWDAGEEVPV